MWKDEGDGGGVRGDKGVKQVSASFRLYIIVIGEKLKMNFKEMYNAT